LWDEAEDAVNAGNESSVMPITDEEAALEAIATIAAPTDEQQKFQSDVTAILSSDNPFIDIHELFRLYNILYFRSLLLPRVEVSWSSRLTLCAGICELVRDPENGNKYNRIRLKLSEPLLKFRPRSDVINTLLHEAIHAYFFITTSWRHSRGDDGTGHGQGFLLLADAINNHGHYDVTVFHTFHDEVDSYRTHIWQCDGPCQSRPPFFGLVKRSMNRAPGKSDSWWARHSEECGGTYTKISEPELTKSQLEKMGGLKKAGMQKNKIDNFVAKGKSKRNPKSPDQENSALTGDNDAANYADDSKSIVCCPICSLDIDEEAINYHLDTEHPA
jgi:hypothetical protein